MQAHAGACSVELHGGDNGWLVTTGLGFEHSNISAALGTGRSFVFHLGSEAGNDDSLCEPWEVLETKVRFMELAHGSNMST